LRNALLDAIETAVGVSADPETPHRRFACDGDVASTGTVIATMNLPSDWMAAASAGSKALLGTWQDLAADATGTVAHYESARATARPRSAAVSRDWRRRRHHPRQCQRQPRSGDLAHELDADRAERLNQRSG
jgi:hypothetical protein